MEKFWTQMMEMVAGHGRYIEFYRIVHFKMVKTANFMFCVFYHYKQLSGDIQVVELDCAVWASDVHPGLGGRHLRGGL